MKYNNKDLAYIDKHYGENLAKFCRSNFPEILEHEGMLQDIITNTFALTKSLYEDITKNESQDKFKRFIFSLFNEQKLNETKQKFEPKTPEELMDEAGYILFPECKSEKDIQAFRKYYYRPTPLKKEVENAERLEDRQGEELCTFNGGRLRSCRVWFAVKKDAVDLNNPYYKRENWKEPKRQDDYGTSVISIQFSHDSNWLSIKNRYNHSVDNPDSTFSNDLENIRAGLTEAFEKTYNIISKKQQATPFELNDYVRASDGKFYRYNMEINNIYYCENNVIIENGESKQLNSSEFMLIDEHVLDLKNKKFLKETSFSKSVGKISFIEILTNKEKKTRTILITPKQGEKVEIEIDKHNEIVGYKNHNVEAVGDGFLLNNTALTTIDLANLQTARNDFLKYNTALTKLDLPNLETVGNYFLFYNCGIKSLNLPKLKSVEDDFMYCNNELITLNLPSLKYAGNNFFYRNETLTSINLASLISVQDTFIFYNLDIETVYLPNLKYAGEDFLCNNKKLTYLDLPNLTCAKRNFLLYNHDLTTLKSQSLRSAEENFLYSNEELTTLYLPNLQKAGNNFLTNNEKLTTLQIPNLQIVGEWFLEANKKINEVKLPRLKSAGTGFLYKNEELTYLSLANLKSVRSRFLFHNKKLTHLLTPNLKSTQYYFLARNKSLTYFKMKKFGNSDIYRKLSNIVKKNKELEME